MAWAPEPQTLAHLAQLLRDSLDARDKTAQKNAELTLKQAKSNPDLNNYLTWLCTNTTPVNGMSSDAYHSARSAAAIMLKNNVKTSYKSIPDANKAYIRSTILTALQDPTTQIRGYAGNVITEMVHQGGILGWQSVLPELFALVESSQGNISNEAQDGAMGAILKICEDNKRALNKEYDGQRPLDVLVPKLLDFSRSPNAKVRAKALNTLNFFLRDPLPKAVQSNIENILLQLFQTANDQDQEVRRFVCRMFTSLTTAVPELIAPHLDGIINYIVIQQRSDPESDLALEAAEFFFENCEIDELRDGFAQHLDKIIPVLLESMVYGENDQARLEAEGEEDADQEDNEYDIKPQFATSKDAMGSGGSNSKTPDGASQPTKSPQNGYAYEDDDLSEGEIDEDDEYDPEEEWSLRKCSAAALDSFAGRYHGPVFEVTLPYLKENLNHQDWPNREAAVLALGAISTGCMEVVEPHLPDLTRFLLGLLNDPQPLVRQITCWALSRYCSWAARLDVSAKQEYFEPMMDGILQCMLDKNKRVQQAAASAFANLEEEAKSQLIPYSLIIAQQFVRCFEGYKDKNMFILYDCVQTLADNIGGEMAKPEMVDLLMPALAARWTKVPDASREMFPLLECLAYVATAMGNALNPFADPFFSRCINIVYHNLEESSRAAGDPVFESPDKDFLVTSLDLLSAIIQALDTERSRELVRGAQPNFFELLAYCMRDPNNDVRQSAYALLGDCAIYCFPELAPYLPSIMKILIEQLDLSSAVEDPETAFRVINNACWSLGEIAMREGTGMGPYIDQLLNLLGTILLNDKVPESLNENAAIALGRLGVANDQQLAKYLPNFAAPFLRAIQQVSWTDEKRNALQGFVKIVADNPQALEQCLVPFFSEMASAQIHAIRLSDDVQKVILQYKDMIPDFDGFLHHLPAPQYEALKKAYNL